VDDEDKKKKAVDKIKEQEVAGVPAERNQSFVSYHVLPFFLG